MLIQKYRQRENTLSYLIQSASEVALIDAGGENQEIFDFVKERKARIKYLFQTRDVEEKREQVKTLAADTEAKIIYGPKAHPDIEGHVAEDMEIFRLGDINIKLLHTPGISPESTVYLLLDEGVEDFALFTGMNFPPISLSDENAENRVLFHQAEQALSYYDSLTRKILSLNDKLAVYPGWLSREASLQATASGLTLGQLKRHHPLLQNYFDKEEFVKMLIQ